MSFAQRGDGLWTEEIEATTNLESEFLKASKKEKEKEGEREREYVRVWSYVERDFIVWSSRENFSVFPPLYVERDREVHYQILILWKVNYNASSLTVTILHPLIYFYVVLDWKYVKEKKLSILYSY